MYKKKLNCLLKIFLRGNAKHDAIYWLAGDQFLYITFSNALQRTLSGVNSKVQSQFGQQNYMV